MHGPVEIPDVDRDDAHPLIVDPQWIVEGIDAEPVL
jgi:hypothetical protein